MSILFYRRPDYLDKSSGPITNTECSRYVERAKNSKRSIPNGLSFEDIMEKVSLPPCTLNDFMDYLVYVEHNAENLQFYLWYKDYARRFELLPDAEKALSTEWVSTDDAPNLAKDGEKKGTPMGMKPKRFTLATMVDANYEATTGAELFNEDGGPRPRSNIKDSASMVGSTISEATTLTTAEVTAQAGLKWQPFTIQPGRDEVNRIMRHYLAFNSPRELNLSHKDRALCLHALQHTTHPSAFAPAVKIAEAALRGQSHPNFVRWSICNGNKPRVFFVRTMGIFHIFLGFLVAVLLMLSHASRWYRILAALPMFIGSSSMVAAYKGLCVILHKSHTRNLHPWEQEMDMELGESSRRASVTSSTNRTRDLASRTGNFDYDSDKDNADGSLETGNLSTFGPKNNNWVNASWADKYSKKPLLGKVFEENVWTQDEALRLLQDKIVLGANLWGLIVTTIFTIVFVAIPVIGVY